MLKKIKKFFSKLKTRNFNDEKDKEVSYKMQEPDGTTLSSDTYIFDLKGNFYNGGQVRCDVRESDVHVKGDTPPLKIKVKPIDVLNEIEEPPRALSLSNIDDKISILRDKEELIRNSYAKRELLGLIECLEYRKQYGKFSKFFNTFSTTTLEKIDALLKTHDLVMSEADLFIPEFPDDAVEIMKEYSKNVKKITNKKAIFYVIATNDSFKKAYDKRDPILLAQSPFGFYYDILGAWDKEMLLLSEL